MSKRDCGSKSTVNSSPKRGKWSSPRKALRSLDNVLQLAQATHINNINNKPVKPLLSKHTNSDEQLDEFEIDEIFKHRIDMNGLLSYFVRWRNWEPCFDSWEPSDHLQHCPIVLQDYELKLADVGESISMHLDKCKYLCKALPRHKVLEFSIAPGLNRTQIELLDICLSNKNKVNQPVVCNNPKDLLNAWVCKVNEVCLQAGIANIQVSNKVDNELPPQHYTFLTKMRISKKCSNKIDLANLSQFTSGCQCNNCGSKGEKCCPQENLGDEMNGRINYHPNTNRIKVHRGGAVYECNSRCNCDETCPNRVVQKGRQIVLDIFKTKSKGWGVCAVNVIPKGTFIEEYIGELLTTEEAEDRGKETPEHATYLFDLDADNDVKECEFTVDARNYGNAAHFFNHSCDPNMHLYNVYGEVQDSRLPRLAFFAARHIKRGEELTFDYRCDTDTTQQVGTPSKYDRVINCKCGAENCRKKFRV